DAQTLAGQLILSHVVVAGRAAMHAPVLAEVQGHPGTVDDAAAVDVLHYPLAALQQTGCVAATSFQLLTLHLNPDLLRVAHATHAVFTQLVTELQPYLRLSITEPFTAAVTGPVALGRQLPFVQPAQGHLALLHAQ